MLVDLTRDEYRDLMILLDIGHHVACVGLDDQCEDHEFIQENINKFKIKSLQ